MPRGQPLIPADVFRCSCYEVPVALPDSIGVTSEFRVGRKDGRIHPPGVYLAGSVLGGQGPDLTGSSKGTDLFQRHLMAGWKKGWLCLYYLRQALTAALRKRRDGRAQKRAQDPSRGGA